jgi:hypothetical protein
MGYYEGGDGAVGAVYLGAPGYVGADLGGGSC